MPDDEIKVGDLVECLPDDGWAEHRLNGMVEQIGQQYRVSRLETREIVLGSPILIAQLVHTDSGTNTKWVWPVKSLKKIRSTGFPSEYPLAKEPPPEPRAPWAK